MPVSVAEIVDTLMLDKAEYLGCRWKYGYQLALNGRMYREETG